MKKEKQDIQVKNDIKTKFLKLLKVLYPNLELYDYQINNDIISVVFVYNSSLYYKQMSYRELFKIAENKSKRFLQDIKDIESRFNPSEILGVGFKSQDKLILFSNETIKNILSSNIIDKITEHYMNCLYQSKEDQEMFVFNIDKWFMKDNVQFSRFNPVILRDKSFTKIKPVSFISGTKLPEKVMVEFSRKLVVRPIITNVTQIDPTMNQGNTIKVTIELQVCYLFKTKRKYKLLYDSGEILKLKTKQDKIKDRLVDVRREVIILGLLPILNLKFKE